MKKQMKVYGSDEKIEITVLLPSWNEALSIPLVVEDFLRLADDHEMYFFRLLFIDDGSDDGTWEAIQRASADCHEITVRGIQLPTHLGKAKAQAIGLRAVVPAKSPVVFMDSDGQHPSRLLPSAIDACLRTGVCQLAERVGYNRSTLSRVGINALGVLVSLVNAPQTLNLGEFGVLTAQAANRLARSSDLGLLPIIPLIQQVCPNYSQFPAPVADRLDGSSQGRWTTSQLWHKALLHLLVDPWKLLPRLALLVVIILGLLGVYGLFIGMYSVIQGQFLGVGSILVALIISVGLLAVLQIMTLGLMIVNMRSPKNLDETINPAVNWKSNE